MICEMHLPVQRLQGRTLSMSEEERCAGGGKSSGARGQRQGCLICYGTSFVGLFSNYDEKSLKGLIREVKSCD